MLSSFYIKRCVLAIVIAEIGHPNLSDNTIHLAYELNVAEIYLRRWAFLWAYVPASFFEDLFESLFDFSPLKNIGGIDCYTIASFDRLLDINETDRHCDGQIYA